MIGREETVPEAGDQAFIPDFATRHATHVTLSSQLPFVSQGVGQALVYRLSAHWAAFPRLRGQACCIGTHR